MRLAAFAGVRFGSTEAGGWKLRCTAELTSVY
jgi:hypothetical protein